MIVSMALTCTRPQTLGHCTHAHSHLQTPRSQACRGTRCYPQSCQHLSHTAHTLATTSRQQTCPQHIRRMRAPRPTPEICLHASKASVHASKASRRTLPLAKSSLVHQTVSPLLSHTAHRPLPPSPSAYTACYTIAEHLQSLIALSLTSHWHFSPCYTRAVRLRSGLWQPSAQKQDTSRTSVAVGAVKRSAAVRGRQGYGAKASAAEALSAALCRL